MNVEALFELAQRQLQAGHLAGAVETLKRALSQDPEHAGAHAFLALVLCDQRRLYAAEHEARLALALEPDGRLQLLASGRIEVAHRRFKPALERFERMRELNPSDPQALIELANVHQLRGRRDDARALLEQAIALDPEAPEPVADLGHVELESGRIDEAQRRAQQALELSPEYHDALVLMGHVLVHQDRLDEAREHAVWALQQNPASRPALSLIVAIKTRKSLILGLWWRYSVWMGALGDGRAILVLLIAYVAYRFGVITADVAGRGDLGELINAVWLGIVAYTWFGPALFMQSLKKELSTVQMGKDF